MFRNQRVIGLFRLVVGRSGCVPASLPVVALWALPARAEPAASAAEKVRESVRTFPSAGKPIKVHRFEPATAEKRPAVLLLHGADGPEANQALYHGAARRLAARGYQVLFVHYFGRTEAGDKDVQGVGEQFKRSLLPQVQQLTADLHPGQPEELPGGVGPDLPQGPLQP
jgi:hypothetical protein